MARRKLLHADDVPRWRQYVRELLADQWDVISVNDCDCVIEQIQRHEVDVVVLDHLMPGFGPDTTGFDLCQRIRRDHPEVGVVLYTGAWNDVQVNRDQLESKVGAPVVFKDGNDPISDDLLAQVSALR